MDRDNLLETSLEQVKSIELSQLKRHLMVRYNGEEGLDYGGIARQWFSECLLVRGGNRFRFFELSHEIFNPYYCLFERNSNYTLQVFRCFYVSLL